MIKILIKLYNQQYTKICWYFLQIQIYLNICAKYLFKILLLKVSFLLSWSIEKLAAIEPINIPILLSIFDPISKAHNAKNVSPAPIVSIFFWLKAGQETVLFFLGQN